MITVETNQAMKQRPLQQFLTHMLYVFAIIMIFYHERTKFTWAEAQDANWVDTPLKVISQLTPKPLPSLYFLI